MNTNYSSTIPEVMIRDRARRTLNYNVREMTLDEIKELWNQERPDEGTEPDDWYIEEHKYAYNSVTVGGARWHYSGIVEAIIRDKYSADEMEAITNNLNNVVHEFFTALVSFNLGQAIKVIKEFRTDEDVIAFTSMQEWRLFAKKTAKEIFNK